jgi:hypothetical protein
MHLAGAVSVVAVEMLELQLLILVAIAVGLAHFSGSLVYIILLCAYLCICKYSRCSDLHDLHA